MPDPLSRVCPRGPYNFVTANLQKRPELMSLVGGCIAQWSIAEAHLGSFLVAITEAQARATLAMFSALNSNAAKVAMIEAAASAALPEDKLEMFEAILPLIRRAAKQRHKFAHHVWGVCDELPEALLLVDPQHTLNFVVTTTEFATGLQQAQSVGERYPEFSRDEIFVYRRSDFETYISETAEAAKLMHYLTIAVSTIWGKPEFIEHLHARPAFQTALERLRKKRERRD